MPYIAVAKFFCLLYDNMILRIEGHAFARRTNPTRSDR